MKNTLWTKNFTLITVASAIGAIGGIAGQFALSFLVYDETKSTLASALLFAIQIIPNLVIPLFISPIMDRLPRKPFLVGGDVLNSLVYFIVAIYLLNFEFSYIAYLMFSLVLASLGSFDNLAYTSFYPKLLPKNFEEKGYTVSSMLYPILNVVMMPIAAFLFENIEVGYIILIQSALSLVAAIVENQIKIEEKVDKNAKGFSFKLWTDDLKNAFKYLKNERGLQGIFGYCALSNGIFSGSSSILVAFFRTAPGMTVTMYSLFSVVEFIGRSIGGLFHYFYKIPSKSRYKFAFFVYQTYDIMDAILLWLPYPLMLVNRCFCGFLGINSATIRESSVQRYIPEEYRSRINALSLIINSVSFGLLSLAIGALGEVLDYKWCFTVCGLSSLAFCFITIFLNRKHVAKVYNLPDDEELITSEKAE